MRVNSFIQHLSEGLYDPGIFKAFFLAGGPGSGKTFVTSSAFAGSGLKVVNSDAAFERNLKKANLSLNMPDEETYFRDIVRKAAKRTAISQLDKYVEGRLGLVVDSTGRDYDIIARNHNMLKQMGYDCYMVFVNTTLDVALERNSQRDRVLPEKIVTQSWKDVQKNIGRFQQIFGNNFVVVDNSDTLDEEQAAKKFSTYVKKYADKWAKSPIKNPMGKFWVKKQLQLKNAMGK